MKRDVSDDQLNSVLEAVSKFAFRPRSHPGLGYPVGKNFLTKVEGGTHPADVISCWVSNFPLNRPVVIYFHGNGELARNYVDVKRTQENSDSRFSLIQDLKLNVLFAEYRGYGLSDGTPSFNTLYLDCEHIFDHLVEKYKLTHSQIIVWGRSIGSIPAIQLASKKDILALVLDSPLAHPTEVFTKNPALKSLLPDDLSIDIADTIENSFFEHQHKIGHVECPVFIATAAGDNLIGSSGELLYDWCSRGVEEKPNVEDKRNYKKYTKSNCWWIDFKGGDHNSIWRDNSQAYSEELTDFFENIVKMNRKKSHLSCIIS